MSTFPRLKTQAVAQYPAIRTVVFSTSVIPFMDGQEQRFRDFAAPLLAWTIDLSQLDDEEVSNLEAFFIEQSGTFSAFDFVDPWNETVYSGCTLDNPELLLQYQGNQAGAVQLIVRQNRS